MRLAKLGWTITRLLFGIFFLYAPIMILITTGGQHPPESAPAAAAFAHALNETGFMNPMLIAVLLIGGAAMLFDRTAPVGLILLAPPVAVIAAFHWFLTGNLVWGSVWPVWFAVLAWHYRTVFARLWQPRQSA